VIFADLPQERRGIAARGKREAEFEIGAAVVLPHREVEALRVVTERTTTSNTFQGPGAG
jgi:hypothetical protein